MPASSNGSSPSAETAEFRAVLVLPALVVAHPEEASDVLLALRDLGAGTTMRWSEFVDEHSENDQTVGDFLRSAVAGADDAAGWTCEPFRRWALEVSRYSFVTGQRVFATAGDAAQVASATV